MSDAPKRLWHVIDRRGKILNSPDAHVEPCAEVAHAFAEYVRADLHANLIKAANELAARFVVALDELADCSIELTGEDYNCPDHNDALAAFHEAKEKFNET